MTQLFGLQHRGDGEIDTRLKQHQHQQYVFGGLFSSISPPPLVCQGGILVSSALSTWETGLAEWQDNTC